jgi:hypothetical protein
MTDAYAPPGRGAAQPRVVAMTCGTAGQQGGPSAAQGPCAAPGHDDYECSLAELRGGWGLLRSDGASLLRGRYG